MACSWKILYKRLSRHVLRSLINSTVEDVCMKEGLGAKQVESMLSRSFFGEEPVNHISYIGTIGLDGLH